MIMRWCILQTNEHDLQAITHPNICKYRILNINNGNKVPVFMDIFDSEAKSVGKWKGKWNSKIKLRILGGNAVIQLHYQFTPTWSYNAFPQKVAAVHQANCLFEICYLRMPLEKHFQAIACAVPTCYPRSLTKMLFKYKVTSIAEDEEL